MQRYLVNYGQNADNTRIIVFSFKFRSYRKRTEAAQIKCTDTKGMLSMIGL